MVMALLTCLWTYTFGYARVTEENKDTPVPFVFALAIVPCDALLMYPGTDALGIPSDSRFYTLLFILAIIHGFGFYFMQKGIEKHLHDLTSG